jgi:hypothetical protein
MSQWHTATLVNFEILLLVLPHGAGDATLLSHWLRWGRSCELFAEAGLKPRFSLSLPSSWD